MFFRAEQTEAKAKKGKINEFASIPLFSRYTFLTLDMLEI